MVGNVLCVGVAVLDNIFAVREIPSEPIKLFATEFKQIGGGPAANAAVTITRLGGNAALWARVGSDPIGQRLVTELDECGVDVTYVKQVRGHRTAVSSIMVDERGDRLIIAFADRGMEKDAGWLPSERISDYDVVLCDARWPVAAETVLRNAWQRGITTILDADLTDDDAVDRLLPLASHVVFSAPALERLTGQAAPAEGLRAAACRGSGVMSVTLGSRGYLWLSEDGLAHVPAAQVEVVDTLAAGDVFHGAFALGLAERMNHQEAALFATATAGLKCMHWGGRAAIPSRSDVDQFLACSLDPAVTLAPITEGGTS